VSILYSIQDAVFLNQAKTEFFRVMRTRAVAIRVVLLARCTKSLPAVRARLAIRRKDYTNTPHCAAIASAIP